MSNLGLERALAKRGHRLVRADVGDRYVVEAMLREKINLGGEQSGHVVFLDHNTTGDGMLTALQVLALACGARSAPLSELARVMQRTPQVLKSVRVREQDAVRRAARARARAGASVEARARRRAAAMLRALLGHRAAGARDARGRGHRAHRDAAPRSCARCCASAIGEVGK